MQVIVGKDLIILLISNIIILHKKGITNVELVKIDVKGLENTYAVSVFEKEFLKAVNEPWLDEEPFKRYQKKLIEDLTVLEMEKEKAIDMPQYEKITGEMDLYSIRITKEYQSNLYNLRRSYYNSYSLFRKEQRRLSKGNQTGKKKT